MPNVSILTPIIERNTTMPASFAAGTNRLLIYTVHCNSGTSPVPPSSITCNGITRTPFAGDITAQLRVTSTVFLFLESELATIVNQAVTITGATASIIKSTVQLLQDAEQVTPTNVVKARGSSGTLNLSLTRSSNSLTVLYSLSQNVNYTSILTNPAGTGMIQVGGAVALAHGSMADNAGTVVATSTISTGAQQTAIAINFKSAIQQSANINGGNPVKVGQTGIVIGLSEFSSIPTSVICAYDDGEKSIVVSNIAGDADEITVDLEDRSEEANYPAIGDGLEFTITNGAETTVTTTSLEEKTGEEVVATFAGAIDYWNTYFAYYWKNDGFTVNGGEFVYTTSGFSPDDFLLRADSGFSSTSGGVVSGWFRPASGTGAGNLYYYEFTINDGGITPSSSGSLTSSGLTSSGLTRVGLTSAGL